MLTCAYSLLIHDGKKNFEKNYHALVTLGFMSTKPHVSVPLAQQVKVSLLTKTCLEIIMEQKTYEYLLKQPYVLKYSKG